MASNSDEVQQATRALRHFLDQATDCTDGMLDGTTMAEYRDLIKTMALAVLAIRLNDLSMYGSLTVRAMVEPS